MHQPGEAKKRRRERRFEAMNQYNIINHELRKSSDDQKQNQEKIKESLVKSSALFSAVKKKLDGTAMDAKALKQITSRGLESSKRINMTSRPFDLPRLIRRLRRSASDDRGRRIKNKDFFRLIRERFVNTYLCRAPSLSFFYGTLRPDDLPSKRKITRRVREKFVEAETTRATQKNIEIDVQQDSTPKEVEYIYGQVKELTKDKQEAIDFFRTVVDPNSFTQTVENIFHISFLAKDGWVGLKSDPEKKRAMLTCEESRRVTSPGSQSILSFSMDDYRKWVDAYKIKERAFPARNADKTSR